jgi:hypothetical protein
MIKEERSRKTKAKRESLSVGECLWGKSGGWTMEVERDGLKRKDEFNWLRQKNNKVSKKEK